MRILHVTDLYPPFIGGMEQHVHRLSRVCVEQGHSVMVVTARIPGAPTDEVRDGVLVHRSPLWSAHVPGTMDNPEAPFHPPFLDPSFAHDLVRTVRRYRPDIVHGHGWSMYSTLRPSVQAVAPVMMTLHDYGPECVRRTMLWNGTTQCSGPSLRKCVRCAAPQYGAAKSAVLTPGLRWAQRRHRYATRYVGVSAAVLRTLSRVLPPEVPTQVIPPPMEDTADIPRTRPDWAPAGRYVMFVGALGPHKGLSEVLESWRALKAAGEASDVTLLVVGTRRHDTPDDWPADVVVRENVPHRQVLQAWAGAEAGVAPSLWPEPFGLVAVEAMTFGVPVIVTDVGGLPEIVTSGADGVVVPAGDAARITTALTQLLSVPSLRQRMGQAARVTSRRFELGTVVQQNLDAYDTTIRTAAAHDPATSGSR